MNSTIQKIFKDFKVNGIEIPVSFIKYEGHEKPYITYMETDKDNTLAGEDEILGFVSYYDFDIYSKGNYLEIIEKVKELMKANGFMWQPSRDSEDMYETDTGYYHKTICFAIEMEV